ncbi:BspA family leucine-rich repeat surface protein [Lactobacillus melliventris]|uniref:BspA family leucine-rich repeat surface protein n=1 Tax=Lactobacillus melliventris TaxID=1218507 RepID=UPI001580FDE1|nr:BspA family leucine-rich repeat surface protein [Lactobacillus melliventris]NUE97676.1 BspA family leucine-rich repeat surface protein [Lactobacillus melliventris]
MNMHKNTNKQGEKILLSGIAAAALGLINAKPQTVKAANQNGTRATKKTARKVVKTKLNYQTETEGETATDNDSTDHNSDNQIDGSEINTNIAADNASFPSSTDSTKTDKQEKDPTQFDPAKATRDGSNTISSTWEDIPVTFNNGVLSIGEEGKSYTINNSDDKNISIGSNIDNVSGDDITEIDINAPIAIIGSAQMLFSRLTNLNTINGLDKLDTSKVTSMLRMFFDCKKIVSLDLSSFDTTNVTSFNIMFSGDPNLTSVDLSSFTVSDDATTVGMFSLIKGYTSSLTKLILGKGFKFTTSNGRPNNSLQQPGTWVNMGAGEGSPAKGTNIWTSDELMTNYQGDRDHDTYVRYTGGTVTVHRQDEDGKQLVDQSGKQIPDEKLFGNISDSVTVDTSKEFAGYTFKENKNSDVKAFTSDPQDITLVYSKSKTDNTWEGVPFTFNNGVLSLGEKDKDYSIDNTAENEIGINKNISTINTDNITEIDILGKITINGPADSLFDTLPNLTQINGLNNLITSNITDMSYMFADCPKLVSLDLSSFDTSKVAFFSSMFYADTDLSSINLSSFTIADDAVDYSLFDSCTDLTKLVLGKGIKFTTTNDLPNDSLQQPGTWVNMGEGNGSLTKGTNQWSSADLMTNYQGDRDHDTYVRYTGGIVTIHRQDEDGKQLVDQDGKEIPDEKLFGNISDPVTVDTSKEFAGYTFKENKNSDVKAFTSDPQDITLVYSKSKTDNTSDNTWEGVPYTFNNGVLSLGEKGKNYKIDNSGNKEKSYALDTRDISISQNIKGVNVDEIKEIDLNAPIAIIGSANGVFKNLKNLATIKGLDNLDTSQVTDFSQMFSGDTALTSADLSNFQVAANAEMTDMFSSCSSLTELSLGKDFKFIGSTGLNDLSGTWVNMGAGEGSPAKGTNKWTSADLITNYQGDTNHDIYVRFTNLGGKITINYRDQDGKEIPGVPAEVNFGNENDKLINDDPVTTFKLKDTLKDSSGTEYQFDHAVQNNSRITLSDVTYSASANPQGITLVYTKKTGTGSNGSGSNGSSSNGSGSNGSGSNNGSGNSSPNTSVPNNNISSGNNGSVNNPSSSNSQGSNSQGSNTGNSNNNSSSASNGQNNGNNLPNNEPNNIPSPVNRKPKTVRPHKTINKGFNINDQNAIHNQQLANSLKNNGSSSNAQNNASNTLPQTGNDKHNSLAMLALGSLALATALGAAWFGRKKD